MDKELAVIHRIREFNRFYTVMFGMLNRKFLDSGYSVTESRILFELSLSQTCTANFLAEKLHVDKSYMSRILKAFEEKGLITRQVSPDDGRVFILRLTDRGRQETAGLIDSANKQIKALIAPLSTQDCTELCTAMDLITERLTDHTQKPTDSEDIRRENGITIRTYIPGDPSRVTYFYYKLYEKQYGFNGSVEHYFIEGMSELFDDPQGSQMWVVEKSGEIVGSVAIVKKGAQEAQLRWFGVDMSLQGLGIGNQLLEIAMQFCKAHRYKHVLLWTIEMLKPARHLYGKHGFVLTETKPNYEWADHPLLEEKWEYTES